jgi:hypothetical protein
MTISDGNAGGTGAIIAKLTKRTDCLPYLMELSYACVAR